MQHQNKSKAQLRAELAFLHQRISELERTAAQHREEEQSLRASEAALRSLLENAPDAILSLDQEGTILFTNEAPPDVSPAELVGQRVYNFTTPEHAEKLKRAIAAVFKTGETASYEHIDSKGHWQATRVSPITKNGKTVAAAVIGTNINDYKCLQEEHNQLLAAEHKQRQLAEALREAGIALSSTLDLDTIIDSLLEQIGRVVPYDAANIMVVNKGIAKITRARGYELFGQETPLKITGLCFKIAKTPNLQRMVETRQPLVIPNTAEDPTWFHIRPSDQIRSWAGAPIMVQDEVVAFFSLDKAEANFYHPDDAKHLAAFAGQAAVAIKNARLFQEIHSALAKTEALYRAGQALIGAENISAALQAVATLVAETLPAHAVVLSVLNAEEAHVVKFVKSGPGAKDIEPVTFEGITAALEKWTAKEDDNHPDSAKDIARTVITVPLRYRGKILGAMTAINQKTAPSYSEEDVDLLLAMANQVAMSFQNARLHEKTHRQARLVQQLLDTIPQGILLLDGEHRVKIANPTAQQFLALLAESGTGKKVTHLGESSLSEILTSPQADNGTKYIWQVTRYGFSTFWLNPLKKTRPSKDG